MKVCVALWISVYIAACSGVLFDGHASKQKLCQTSYIPTCTSIFGRSCAINFWTLQNIDCSTSFLWVDKEKIITEGRSTTVTCLYDKKYKFYKKYWCRGSSRTSCDILGDTENVKWYDKRKLLLSDSSRTGTFTVILRQLTEDDSGTYWCGIEKPYADIMIQVKLVVKRDPARHGSIRTTPSSTPSSNFFTTTLSTVEMTATSPGSSKFLLNVSFSSNSSGLLNVTKGNQNCNSWDILRWVILIILLASLTVIRWNRIH